ncbi:MAG: DUF3012 domain-containing protein [Oceanicoccus sp.]
MTTATKLVGLLITSIFLLTACSPKVGSEEWCTQLKEKPKGDWTTNEAGDFARHCIFK